jgi:hypothetical protein
MLILICGDCMNRIFLDVFPNSAQLNNGSESANFFFEILKWSEYFYRRTEYAWSRGVRHGFAI